MSKDLRAAKNFTNRLASGLRVNGHVMLHEHPCKIVNMTSNSTGKHGHAMTHVVGVHLITARKYEHIFKSTHTANVPVVQKKEFVVVDMNKEGWLAIMDDGGVIRHDLRVEDDAIRQSIAERIDKQGDEDILVTVLKVLNQEVVMATKIGVK
ncbi:IF5A-like protein [Mya arenaria]|uniref:Eukaryotic translation initiation factor 5A n=1 Tax=Mya arenaria TaxID=6604 RepID=A0ABY7EUS2_MYAAR|nr:IF5A-like protein [Mya arenaria]